MKSAFLHAARSPSWLIHFSHRSCFFCLVSAEVYPRPRCLKRNKTGKKLLYEGCRGQRTRLTRRGIRTLQPRRLQLFLPGTFPGRQELAEWVLFLHHSVSLKGRRQGKGQPQPSAMSSSALQEASQMVLNGFSSLGRASTENPRIVMKIHPEALGRANGEGKWGGQMAPTMKTKK